VSETGSTPLRVLVLSAGPWNAGARQLALGARALVAEGISVRALTPSVPEWTRAAPSVPAELLTAEHGTRAHRTAVTAAVEAAQPNVVITDDELLRRLAVRAVASGACVLQRLALGAPLPEDSVATRFASRNVAPAWLVPSTNDTLLARSSATPEQRRIPAVPIPIAVSAPRLGSTPTTAPRTLLLIAAPEAPLAATSALRVSAMLVRRHSALRVVLCGSPSMLQPLRVHAAALRVAAQVEVVPFPTFDDPPPADLLSTWVAADGDVGVSAALWSMRAGHPVVTMGEGDVAALLDDRVSGVLVPGGSPYDDALTASELARLLAQPADRARMGEAAMQRAQQFDEARLGRALRTAISRAQSAARR
jgi:hypothetical protein